MSGIRQRHRFIGDILCFLDPIEGRCAAVVYEKDTYRRTGRGKWGFEMHYNERQCRRKVRAGEGLCAQHKPLGTPVVSVSERRER